MNEQEEGWAMVLVASGWMYVRKRVVRRQVVTWVAD